MITWKWPLPQGVPRPRLVPERAGQGNGERSRTPSPARPRHVALILDGNGRWAAARGLPRASGHEAGVRALFPVLDTLLEEGIEYVSLFVFSTENWNRPQEELRNLQRLARRTAHSFRRYADRGVRFRWLGAEDRLPGRLVEALRRAEAETRSNQSMTVAFCCNHGGRAEISQTAAALASAAVSGTLDPGAIDEQVFTRHLPHPEVPDIDMLIRTSGEHRISNFMLWRAAYAEIFFVDTLWPDFTGEELRHLIDDFGRRRRRFGAIAAGG
ncbi:polyprenyl diphosphate synthase [Streptomyces macrosporus]|uniref:Isoprenyl transferase n=1 Tax=Streptomyces macrosporus TaxID=44032 RepID=A0ABP5WSK7_9ACTN